MRRRTWLAAPAAAALLFAATTTGVAAAPVEPPDAEELRDQLTALGMQWVDKDSPTKAEIQGDAPMPANPWLSMLPPDQLETVDWAYWRELMDERSKAGAPALPPRRSAIDGIDDEEILVDEEEPDAIRGGNDTLASAQLVAGLGTGDGDSGQARILGTLAAPPTVEAPPSSEDDGSIDQANELPLEPGAVATTSGRIGDGPFGDTSGDFDHFSLGDRTAGELVSIDVDSPPSSSLDSVVIVYDADGNAVALNDDDGETFDSALMFPVPADGSYTVSVLGFASFQADPFDSSSGTGAGSTGGYALSVGVDASDLDHYAVDLEGGDVLSAFVEDAGTRIAVFGPDGGQVIGSAQDASALYPASTQLLGGGNALVDHVARTSGRHTVLVMGGSGNYEAKVRTVRPGFDQRDARQTVFLDFDGERVQTSIFGGPGVRELSPLSAFVGRWGLSADDEDALIDAIVAETEENLRRELRDSGLAGDLRVRVLNSRDHEDVFGRRNVSRVIVGGTIAESGILTIGIAESIDPGNFGSDDTALVLLDILSDPASGEENDPSLNGYLTDESDRVAFVGQAVGNVVSHEIGHYIGSWHVDQFNEVTNLMDQGGNYPLLYGVGPDNVGGTADDLDIDFGEDLFNPNEGFTGFEDTQARSFWALVR